MPRPKIFLVGGPSGAGKDALLAGARAKAADVAFVIRDVTRAAEQCSDLERSVSSDEFATGEYALRWSAHGTTDYGIPSKALEETLAAGRTIVLNVSRGAFAEARQKYAERADVFVLLVTASREALRERLTARARVGDDAEARLKRATAYTPPDARFWPVVRVRNDKSLAEGVDRFVAALERPEEFCVPVVGLVGCSASGKSTLCAELPRDAAAAVVAADDFYKPRDACPRFDLAADIRWPGGVPDAFRERGNADLNHPDSVDWAACADAVDASVEAVVDAGGGGVVIVEGLLLLGAGAERVRDRCAQLVLLDDGYDDPAKQEVLWRRKWTRSGHLGKTSYQQRGVTADEYEAYWGYVAARWKEHGLDRVEAAGRPIHRVDAHADDRSARVESILRALEPS